MAFTQTDIDTLKAAIASGILRVRYSDREVTYQSTADMLQALSLMEQEVNAAAGTPSYGLFNTTKGFGCS
jgi:hypothetical protein